MNHQSKTQGSPAELFIATWIICLIVSAVITLIKTIVVSVGGIMAILKFIGIVALIAISFIVCFVALSFDKN